MIIPTKGRIVVNKLERSEAKSEGGVFIPGQALLEEQLFYGEIVHPGETQYKEGQKIYYSRYSATKCVDEKGNINYILSDLDVMAYDA